MTTNPQPAPSTSHSIPFLVVYLPLGTAFDFVLTQTEVVSWFRIHEMFHFQSFRMYGILGSAVATAAFSVALLKRLGLHAASGERITLADKTLGTGTRYIVGGFLFGLGWALTGACPGPIFSLIGSGLTVYLAVAAAALAGTWLYGCLRPRLPHGTK